MLEKINKPNDIHKIALADFPQLAEEIRQFLIESVSHTGGHLASNLGVVELTMALHNVLEFPEDKIVWDVGHQAYTHKILTGRKEGFKNLRKEGGMSGFPKRCESDCDAFDAGHSSNSISAGLGYVRARDLQGQKYRVVSVIGDGALTGGMAYEALNNAAELKTNFIIVLNDNNMSISKNVGGMSSYLSALRTAEVYTGMKINVTKTLKKIPKVGTAVVDTMRRTKSSIKQLIIPGMLFENMGLTYLGPVDGHDMRQMMKLFNEAKRVEGPVIVHVLTQKGRGYEPASLHPDQFHGTGPFDIRTGRQLTVKKGPSWTDVFSDVMVRLGRENPKLVGITAAMKAGTGLVAFEKAFPERLFDVGIAEEHAVSFAAGLALGGMIPVVAIYSSFLQRAVDQMLHDVCMQNLHVIFAIDRAGLVGADGETHQGCFDLSYLTMMPNMTVMAPKNGRELEKMMEFAVHAAGPCAIRYPRGTALDGIHQAPPQIHEGEAEILRLGEKTAFLAVGNMVETALEAADLLKEEGEAATVVNMRFVKPFDTGMIDQLIEMHDCIITLEDNVITGGFGEQVADYICRRKKEVHIGLVGKYVQLHDAYLSVAEALRHAGYAYGTNIEIEWIDSETINEQTVESLLSGCDGVIVPGGFGNRGIEGKILTAAYCRTHNLPYLGICLGMQVAVIDFARHVCGMEDANSGEFDELSKYKVIDFLPDQSHQIDKGGTLRLGAYPCRIAKGTQMYRCYGTEEISERHRHRYEFNNLYRETLAEGGLVVSGTTPDGNIVKTVEIPQNDFYIGVQFHPEFKSRPNKPHPLFLGLIEAALTKKETNHA